MKTREAGLAKWTVALLVASTLHCSFILCETYYVDPAGNDSGSGTAPSDAWRTVGKAISVAGPGDTVVVRAGIYDESVVTIRSGSPGRPIIFRAQGVAKLTRFYINHNDIHVEGFTFDAPIARWDSYIRIWGDNVSVVNNTIVAHGTDETYGIRHYTKSNRNSTIRGNVVSNTRAPAMDIGGEDHLVENNIVHHYYADAFRSEGCRRCVFRSNEVYAGFEIGRHNDFIQTFGVNGHASYDVLIENNLVYDSEGSICMLQREGADVRDYTFRNNVFYNVADACQPSISGTKFYNNTFVNSGHNTSGVLHFSSATTGHEVVNNLFVETGKYSNGWYDVDGVLGCPSGFCDHNFFSRGPSYGWDGRQGFNEAHGLNGGDPRFVDYAGRNLRLESNSPAVDAALALAGFWMDLEGKVRPQGAGWDMGAYETSGSGVVAPAPPANLRKAE